MKIANLKCHIKKQKPDKNEYVPVHEMSGKKRQNGVLKKSLENKNNAVTMKNGRDLLFDGELLNVDWTLRNGG